MRILWIILIALGITAIVIALVGTFYFLLIQNTPTPNELTATYGADILQEWLTAVATQTP